MYLFEHSSTIAARCAFTRKYITPHDGRGGGGQRTNKLTTGRAFFHRLSFHHSFGKRWCSRLSLCAALSCGVDFWGTPVVGAQTGWTPSDYRRPVSVPQINDHQYRCALLPTSRETMAAIEARGLTAVLVLLLSVLHASAWVTPGLARQGSFVSQVNRQRRQKWSW